MLSPPPLVLPVVGETTYTDTFGAPRDGGARTHEGTDIMTGGVKAAGQLVCGQNRNVPHPRVTLA